MSVWDWISGKAPLEKIGGLVQHALGIPDASEKRRQNQLITDQVDAYKKQTEIAQSEIAQKRDEQNVERRRIDEKTIKSLRRNFKPAGFLGSEDIAGLPNKLGA